MKRKKAASRVYRQGDVLVIATEKVPSGLTEVPLERGLIVLAHGEATGHMHAINPFAHGGEVPVAVLFQTPDQVDRILRAKAPIRLYHDEHADIELPAGDYVIRRQREYAWGSERQVAD